MIKEEVLLLEGIPRVETLLHHPFFFLRWCLSEKRMYFDIYNSIFLHQPLFRLNGIYQA